MTAKQKPLENGVFNALHFISFRFVSFCCRVSQLINMHIIKLIRVKSVYAYMCFVYISLCARIRFLIFFRVSYSGCCCWFFFTFNFSRHWLKQKGINLFRIMFSSARAHCVHMKCDEINCWPAKSQMLSPLHACSSVFAI